VLLALRTHITDTDSPPAIHWRTLVLAGFVGGLAALTRFTAFFLFGMIGFAVLLDLIAYRRVMSVRLFLVRSVAPVIVFTAVLAVTWIALYPGTWMNMNAVVAETLHGFANAGSPHENGNFFMGQAVEDPGVTFYLWALLIRIQPLTLIGVFLALMAVLMGAWGGKLRLGLLLAAYVVFYLIAMTSQAKKFDRYALPVFPMLHLIAAYGLGWLVDKLPLSLRRGGVLPVIAMGAVMLGFSLWYYPQDYAYSNPLIGGGRTAERVILIGAGGHPLLPPRPRAAEDRGSHRHHGHPPRQDQDQRRVPETHHQVISPLPARTCTNQPDRSLNE
jgi:4-amino-4-deoxy-L-arabinose transferase-like glycosyltransferase